jgi:transcriptional regulator with GAF, ATPase, and Fis domain
VNCAALPESLVESELFGHERGAFTGAFERKPGKFELAERGTLFLDEIGDLPSAMQVKLLRVLQERELYRVGGTRSVSINVRLIAATNRNLQEALRDGTFRHDLFYRLSVFPLHLPRLRERGDDVRELADCFLRRSRQQQRKNIVGFTDAAVAQLLAYAWPGNVRELQNVIERAVILARGTEIGPDLLHLPVDTLAPRAPKGDVRPARIDERGSAQVIPFSEAERRAIVRALETTGWRISGGRGAAALLGLKPTTLHAKMKRLGVRRPAAASSNDASPAS